MNRRHALIPLTLITLSVGTSLWSRDSVAERAKRPVTFEAIPMRQGDLITLESALRAPGAASRAALAAVARHRQSRPSVRRELAGP